MAEHADTAEATGEGRGKKEAALQKSLTGFLVFAIFFLALNAITSWGDWWFYWPLFFWGFALVFQAVSLYGAAAPGKMVGLARSMLPGDRAAPSAGPPGSGRGTRSPDRSRAEPVGPSSAALVDEAEARVARLWRSARRLPAGPAREQAFRVCAAADRVAEVMAADKADGETVRWFIDRLLEPTESLLDRYARLTSRGIETAEPTLAKVAGQDLPLIESRLDALYQQLHRGDVVDLAVASEMLEFGLDEAPPIPPRSRTTAGGTSS